MKRIVKKSLNNPLALALLSLGAMALTVLLGDVNLGWLKLHYLFEIIASFYVGVWIRQMKMPNVFSLAFSICPAYTAMGMDSPFWVGLVLVGYPFLFGFYYEGVV